jgi:hypothetical protein
MKGCAEMDTIDVNANTKASSAASEIRFSVLPNAIMVSEQSILPPLTSLEITGHLPGRRRLARPLYVTIAHDDGEVIVSEPHFHMHASAPTTTEALVAFRRIFSGYLDVLASRESRLDPYLREQLAYLRSYISAE